METLQKTCLIHNQKKYTMSKFDDAVATYHKSMTEKMNISDVDADFLRAVTKGCGPSIYNKDASTVSCSDQSELDTVKKNYLIKKLGLTDGPELDAAIKEVCETMGSSNRSKYRAIFYYLLAKKFNKESIYS